MKITSTEIPDVKLIEPAVFKDDRGYFFESWQKEKLKQAGLDLDFVQDNESFSTRGTLRGIHLQIKQPQGKLVRATSGEVFDIAVDLRPNSKTLGKWVGRHLSDENKHMLWIPPGFGHAFLVLSDTAIFNYKCTDYYLHDDQHSLAWDDPEINVQWPDLGETAISLSEKDQHGDSFAEIIGRIKAMASAA